MTPTDRLQLRPITDDELAAYLRLLEHAFGEDVSDEEVERFRIVAEPDRFLAAVGADGTIVGTAGAYTFDVSLPGGGTAPCAGVTVVSVRADHRRQGLLTRMMQAVLEDASRRGEPFAALWASESGIYGRFGFGPAIPTVRIEVPRDRSRFRAEVRADPAAVRIVDAAGALEQLPPVYEQLRRQRPGMLSRPEPWWRRWLGADPKEHRDGAGPRVHALLDGRGYAVYRLKPNWDESVTPDGTVVVEELVGLDPPAQATLWRFVIDTDLSVRTRAYGRPADEVLPLLVAEPAYVRHSAGEPVYVRLLDLPVALTARSYAADGRVVLGVRDAFRPDNSGSWCLEVAGGEARCTATDEAPEIVLDTRDLATVVFGGERTTRLAAAGVVELHRPEAAAMLDRLLATELAPWHTGMF